MSRKHAHARISGATASAHVGTRRWRTSGISRTRRNTFRVHNMAVIVEDKVIEADIEFWLGGAWHNLAIALLNDDHARPIQTDGSTWDPGSPTWGLENPNLPR